MTEKETEKGTTACGIEYGVSSMQGWRVHMEDAHILEPELYAEEVGSDNKTQHPLPGHSLFAVFDGHGGAFAAAYAGRNFCRVLARQGKFVEYARFVKDLPANEARLMGSAERLQHIRSGLELLEGALKDAFIEMDKQILETVNGESVPDSNTPYHPEREATGMDVENQSNTGTGDGGDGSTTNGSTADGDNDEAGGSSNGAAQHGADRPDPKNPQPTEDDDSGTTAVVVVVTPKWIVCANAGDSRSVASKNGNKAFPLSYDHKPDDEEEERRVREAGGHVAGGRVEGDLAVSRGLGDFRYKSEPTVLAGNDLKAGLVPPGEQKVSPVPDIITQNRDPEQEEFVIVACDGIWDVMSNFEGVKAVGDILAEGENDMGLACEEVSDTQYKRVYTGTTPKTSPAFEFALCPAGLVCVSLFMSFLCSQHLSNFTPFCVSVFVFYQSTATRTTAIVRIGRRYVPHVGKQRQHDGLNYPFTDPQTSGGRRCPGQTAKTRTRTERSRGEPTGTITAVSLLTPSMKDRNRKKKWNGTEHAQPQLKLRCKDTDTDPHHKKGRRMVLPD